MLLGPARGALVGEAEATMKESACGYCTVNENGTEHWFTSFGSYRTCDASSCHTKRLANDCYGADSTDVHDACGMEGPAPEEAEAVIKLGDGEALANLLIHFPKRVAVNSLRRSLQVMDCGGHVVANLPLPRPLEELVAE
jgi:hypothetical protein